MGQISTEILGRTGSALSGNQHIEAAPPADTPEIAAKRRLFVALRGFDLSKDQAAALTNGIASGQLPHVQFTVQA